MPTRHRDALQQGCGGQLTLTRHPDGCLLIFPRPAWEQFRERVLALPMSAQWWKRIFLGHAADAELDGTGRMLIAPELREAAGISREALLLGMGTHFELWDKATYRTREAQSAQEPMPAALADICL